MKNFLNGFVKTAAPPAVAAPKESAFDRARAVRMEEMRQKSTPKIVSGRKIVMIRNGMGRKFFYDVASGKRTTGRPEDAVAILTATPAGEVALKKGTPLADLMARKYVEASGDLGMLIRLGAKIPLEKAIIGAA